MSDCACCRALLQSYVNSPEKIPGACEFVINALRYVQKNAPRYYKQTFSLIVSLPVFFINFRSVRLQFLWIYSVYVSFVNGLVVKVMDRYKFYSYLYEPWRSSSWSCYLTWFQKYWHTGKSGHVHVPEYGEAITLDVLPVICVLLYLFTYDFYYGVLR